MLSELLYVVVLWVASSGILCPIAGVNLLQESNLIAGLLLNAMFLLGTFTFAVVLGVVSDDISSEVKVCFGHLFQRICFVLEHASHTSFTLQSLCFSWNVLAILQRACEQTCKVLMRVWGVSILSVTACICSV